MTREEKIDAQIAEKLARKEALAAEILEAVKTKKAQRQREYRANNKERVAETSARSRAGRADKLKVYHAKYRAENKEKVAAAQAKCRLADKETRRAARRSRRLTITVINELLPGEWEQAVADCGNRCIIPGCGASPVTQDHVTPLSKGGRHHISNLQPICGPCNSSKGVRDTDYR